MDSSLVQTICFNANIPSFVTQQACTQKHTSLISRLLPEILQIIFIYCARDYCTDHTYGYPMMDVPGWVSISYVCRHWRNVALACPALWSFLFISSPRWTRELLARSKWAPLKLKVKLVSEDRLRPVLDFVKQAANHLERIQELNLCLQISNEDIELENEFYPWLSSRAPCLRNLEIAIIWPTPRTRQFSVLFDGDTPALRTLELSGCAAPWYSFNLTGLTALGLSAVPAPHRKTMAEFLGMLRSIRHLESLYLYDALPTTTFFSESHVNIDLPHLSRLSVAAPPLTLVEFLTCVNIPSETELRVYWDYEDGFAFDVYALLFSVLGKRLGTRTDRGISAPIFRSFVMECTAYQATFSALDLDLDPLIHHDWGCYNPLKIRVWLDPSLTVDRFLTDMSPFMPLSNICSVRVISPPFPAKFWRMTLGHLRDLRYIQLSEGNLPDIASVLSLTELAKDDGGARQDGRADRTVLVPALEELVLVGIQLTVRPETSREEPVWEGQQIGDLQSLCDALATRTRIAPGRLVMSSCTGPFDMGMAGEWRGGRFRVTQSHRGRRLRL